MKRLGIFVFYDKYNYVSEHISYLLNEVRQCCDDLYIISNSSLSNSEQAKLRAFSPHLYLRENRGLDAGAMKYFWCELTSEINLSTYDEIFWLNDTCYGPLYPLHDVFLSMEEKSDLDFWGITAHAVNNHRFGKLRYLPEHIQSYFIAVRKSLFLSDTFRTFWNNLPISDDYHKVVREYEIGMTVCFSNAGFHYGVYCDTRSLGIDGNGQNPTFFMIRELISVYHCPFVKKKHLAVSMYDYMALGSGFEQPSVVQYIKENTSYPTEYMIKDLIRLYPVQNIEQNLACDYILSSTGSSLQSAADVAVAISINSCEDLNLVLEHIKSRQLEEYFIILTASESLIKLIPDSVRYILCSSKSLFHMLQEECVVREMSNYHYLCLLGNAFASDCSTEAKCRSRVTMLEDLVLNRYFISNVAECFARNPSLGFLAPYLSAGDFTTAKEAETLSALIEDGTWVTNSVFLNMLNEEESIPAAEFRQKIGMLKGSLIEKYKAQMLLSRISCMEEHGYYKMWQMAMCGHVFNSSVAAESVHLDRRFLIRLIPEAFLRSVKNHLPSIFKLSPSSDVISIRWLIGGLRKYDKRRR